MNRPLRWYDLFTINIYFMGLTTLSQTMTPLVAPLLVQQFVGEANQGAFYGTLRLWSLMVALLVQSLMGTLSDRSTLRWGRRRPFIFIGTIANIFIMVLIGFTAGMQGMTGYWTLFILLLVMSVASNTGHGAVQGLIPDLVPENQRGRYSGVKAILEVPLPVILVSFTIGKMIASGNMWAGLLTAMGVLVFTMLVTMFAPEKRFENPPPLDLAPFVRLLMMTALFTIIILAVGQAVRLVGGAVQNAADTTILVTMGIAGFAAMLVAVALGVWASVQLSIGEAAKENPSFTWWVVNRLAYLVGSTNLASFAVYFLQGRLGLEREKAAGPASQLIMFVGLFILLVAFPSGWLADRFGRKPLVALSGIVATLGTLVLILSPNLTMIYIGAILIGVATGLFYTANWALGTDLVPKEEAGRYLGISNLAGAGAGAVGAYIGGPIADFVTKNIPESPGLGYVLLFAIYGGLFLFSLLALTRVKPPQK
ncbi:MAG: MFS transporter [Anaerolineales bacterium]|nr:MFS transporter [Anaerolineales bacterium]